MNACREPADPQTPTLTSWYATIDLVAADGRHAPGEPPIAAMALTVADPSRGNPLADLLGSPDPDVGELGAALFTPDGHYTRPVAALLGREQGRVTLVDTFEVDPRWRGPQTTPLLALRLLAPFVHLGLQRFALTAAPLIEPGTDITEDEVDRIAESIAAMWARAGFAQAATGSLDGLDNITMAGLLFGSGVQALGRALAGHDPVLRAVHGSRPHGLPVPVAAAALA